MQPDGTLNAERRARRAAGPVRLATRPTGSPAPSGRSARATARSSATTRRSRGSSATASTCALRRAGPRGAVEVSADPGRRRPQRAVVADRRRRRRDRRGDARPRRLRRLPAARRRRRWRSSPRASPRSAPPAGNAVAVRRGAAVGALALDLARLGVTDARRAGRRRASSEPAASSPPRATRRRSRPTCWSRAGRRTAGTPSPSDGTQIAYGADSRLQSLLGGRRRGAAPGLRRLAGIAASWYFGNNPAGAAMYDPATGVTFDGVSADGVDQPQQRRGVDDPRAAVDARARRGAGRRGRGARRAADGPPHLEGARGRVGDARRRRVGRQARGRLDRRERVERRRVRADARGRAGRLRRRRASRAWWSRSRCAPPIASGGFTKWSPLGTLAHVDAGPQGASAIPGLLEVQTLAARVERRRVHRHARPAPPRSTRCSTSR